MKRAVLLFGFIIVFANVVFANTYDISQISQAKLVADYSVTTKVDQMDTVIFGSYYQNNSNNKEPIEWIVLDRQDGKTLLLSKYILDYKCYNDAHQIISWENCTLRYWLNTAFLNTAFNNSEQAIIETTNVINNRSAEYGPEGGSNTIDKVFCLSVDEVKKYFNQPKMDRNNKRAEAKETIYANGVENTFLYMGKHSENNYFWLRTPGRYNDYAATVRDIGSIHEHGFIASSWAMGVRPAIWVLY